MSQPAELCRASYVACHAAGHVVIFAMGLHASAGCMVFFRREPDDVFPPRFSLWHVRAHAADLRLLTPFAASTSFQTTRRVEQVEIVDASGRRSIPVSDGPLPVGTLVH